MGLNSWLYSKRLKLPPRTTAIRIELDLKIEMDDGVVLLADHYLPTNSAGEKLPTVLMRTPYGRGGRGECIRLQVSSGGHPRFMRNTGSGETPGQETTLRLADQQIYHDQAHPSAVGLPWVNLGERQVFD